MIPARITISNLMMILAGELIGDTLHLVCNVRHVTISMTVRHVTISMTVRHVMISMTV